MIIVEKSGLSRMYLPTFNLQMQIPSVESLVKVPDDEICQTFMKHVVLNHKGLNWKIYRHYLDGENYRSFIYAFAYICKDFSTNLGSTWQIDSNARRLNKAISRHNITLSKVESDLIRFCELLSGWSYRSSVREGHLLRVLGELEQQYLG